MNFQQLIAIAQQMKKMGNPTNAMNQNQKKTLNEFKSKSKEEQCNMIAEACNKANISKEQFEQLLNVFKQVSTFFLTIGNWFDINKNKKEIIEITIIMMMILTQSSENKEKKFVHYAMTKTLNQIIKILNN